MAGITIKGLTKSYVGNARMAAVGDLSLDIADGAFVTLLGPSGCGKTTTLRLIAGFIRPDAGTIHAGDRLVSSADEVIAPENRGMGMVFQNYAVWPHKTVHENVAFGLGIRGLARDQIGARVAKALTLVNLSGLEHRYPSELSGGQQQRVALARSLVVEPQILLLDEPLSNLDAKLRERMRSELKDLQRRTGITFVYVTHDQAEALALSDKIAVIHGGRLQQYGRPEDVYERPANRIVADFMGLVNLVPASVAGISGSQGKLVLAPGMEVVAEVPAGVAEGADVELAVRPECVTLSPGGSGAGAMAQVSEKMFLGNLMEYVVKIENGPTLRAQSHPRARFEVGDRVAVGIDAAHCAVFPATKAA
jgi:iron(III) transport system ATP-binding protein